MTREEAKRRLLDAVNCGGCGYEDECNDCIVTATRMAIEALEKSEQYKWHDLRKNPNDLPEINYDNRKSNEVIVLGARGGLNIAYRHLSEVCDAFYTKGNRLWSVIAWREIEPFEEVSE